MLYTHNNLVNLLKNIADAHQQLRGFGYGSYDEINGLPEKQYPFLWVAPLEATPIKNDAGEYNVIQHQFHLEVSDLVQKDLTSLQDVSSDTQLILTDIIKILHEHVQDIDTVSDPVVTWFTEKNNDNVTGWWVDITIEVPFDSNMCDIPVDGFVVPGISTTTGGLQAYLTCDTLADCSTFNDLVDRVTTIEDTYVPESRTLTINGQTYDLSTNRSWTIAATGLPTQTGHAGEFLTTNGTNASWVAIDLSPYATIASLADVAFSGDYNDLINTPDLSQYATLTDLTDYLPLTGGTISGDLVVCPGNLITSTIKACENMSGESLSLFGANSGAGAFVTIDGTRNNITLQTGNTLSEASLVIDAGASVFTDPTASAGGLKYADDYSADFTQRSLVDKAYVDNIIPTNYWTLVGNDLFLVDAYDQVSPDATNTTDLGSQLLRWKNIFPKGRIEFDTTIDIHTVHSIPTPDANSNWQSLGDPYLGDWNISLTPNYGEYVTYLGDIYQNISGSNSVVDPVADGGNNWNYFDTGYTGTWSSSNTYAQGIYVDYSGVLYYHNTTVQEVYSKISYASNEFTFGTSTFNWMKLDSSKLTVARIEPPSGNLVLYASGTLYANANSLVLGQSSFTGYVQVQASSQVNIGVGSSYQFLLQDSNYALFQDNVNGYGIQYQGDYSSTFQNNSLISKLYADTAISTAITSALASYVPYSGATGSVTLGANAISTTVGIITPNVTADGSAGVRINNNSGNAVLTLGAGGGTGATFAGGVVHSTLTGAGTRMVTITNAGLLSVGTIDQDIEITDATKGVILKDSGGGRWRITVSTSGNLITTSI